jgi:hypothetical protein
LSIRLPIAERMENDPRSNQAGSVHASDRARVQIGNNYFQSEDRCLADLRCTDPRHDKSRILQSKDDLLEDAYRWVLDTGEFQRWRDDRHSLLWIKGDPGKGKTMLLCGIIDELSPATRLEDNDAAVLLSYFFCQATDARINSATAVLRGLLYLLADQHPPLVSHIQKQYQHGGKGLFEDANAWWALSEILTNILRDPSLPMTYIIIDALDECVTGLPLLLGLIADKSSTLSRVKWIVSSRNWSSIEERLATQSTMLSLELNHESISAAVHLYIQYKVDQLAQTKAYNDRIRDAVTQHLTSNAQDTFLWVALACQSLKMVPKRKTLSKLAAFPPGLEPFYKRMIEQIYQMDDAQDLTLCKRILAVMTIVYRPVTLYELATLVDELANDPDSPESLPEVIGLCGSFLTIRDGTVYFVHQSARDFLYQEASEELFLKGVETQHHDIFLRSLHVMSKTLRRDIYSLGSPGFPINQIDLPEPDPLAAVRYSCVHWVDHLCDSRPTNGSDSLLGGDPLDEFLCRNYLNWLEALALLKSIAYGLLSLAKLEKMLQV